MLTYMIKNSSLQNDIYIPKYYDPDLKNELLRLEKSHELFRIDDLISEGVIEVSTGDEIGKMSYGTGSIPFVRTSDITNWELKTIPKQGVSQDIYDKYQEKQDVRVGDILLVRDGTYLIGTNCIINELDLPLIYQSHILKIRIKDKRKINPYLFFLSLNSQLVQRQIKNMQFTADIIDTLGNRYKELILPIPKDAKTKKKLITKVRKALEVREKNKAAIKQLPLLVENVLSSGKIEGLTNFFQMSISEIKDILVQDTTTLEFGDTVAYQLNSSLLINNIYLPKYYDPTISQTLESLRENCKLVSIDDLVCNEIISISTGDEIGKMAYGTGSIPFVRTSDFSNWEIKADAKQGVSQEIYELYAEKEDVKEEDIFLVRDGTYLVGTSCIITEQDSQILFCGGLYKIRILDKEYIDPYLLLGLLNSYIVKRQIRTKQFTRDVIDTLGKRIGEVILPIPKNIETSKKLSEEIKRITIQRIIARDEVVELTSEILK